MVPRLHFSPVRARSLEPDAAKRIRRARERARKVSRASFVKDRAEEENFMTPNQITAARVLAAFAPVALYT
jgi:hypothetical protein